MILLGCAQTTFAQTADEIIDKYLTAIGGRAALGKLTSRTTTGNDHTIDAWQGDGSRPGRNLQQPGARTSRRTVIKLDLSSFGAGQMTFDQRFNGNVRLRDSTRCQGNRDIAGNQLENMKKLFVPTPFLITEELGAASVEHGRLRKKSAEGESYRCGPQAKSGSVATAIHRTESYFPSGP